MTIRRIEHATATSLDEAVTLHRDSIGRTPAFIAGGTDLLGALKDNIHPGTPELLIDLKRLDALRGIREEKKSLRIGALTTLADVANHPLVQAKYPALAQAAKSVASPQLRNMGTVGGNLCQEPRCWYYRSPEDAFHCLRKGGDLCGALLGDDRYHSLFGAASTALPACASDCPAHISIPRYMERIRAGELDDAAHALLERNSMPAITGRVCPHFCEEHCTRNGIDAPVSTRAVERTLGDHILANAARFLKPKKKKNGKRVAIVGAGPAGLSAAYYLAQGGYAVTVYDRMPEAGGMLRYCIPAYRLPKDVLAKQLAAYATMGIEFVLGAELGSPKLSLKKLRKDFDAVFLATGGWKQKTLGIEHEERLIPGLDFLVGTMRGSRALPGKKVLVIGGGSVAVDVAITAKRLGAAEVTMACLEARDAMPAFPEDLELALQENIRVLPSFGPHQVLLENGKVAGMELLRCTSVLDAEGRFRPSFDAEIRTRVGADAILVAIGQSPDLGFVGSALETKRGVIVAHSETQATSASDVFAGGEVTTGASTVVAALAAGRRAAISIDTALRGGKPGVEKDVGRAIDVNVEALLRSKSAHVEVRNPAERTLDGEDIATLSVGVINAEAQRCLNCGCIAVNASDLAPALIALDARVRTTTRTLPAEDFFAAGVMSSTVLQPGELVTEILLPEPPPGTVSGYQKFRIRKSIDFPIVGVATSLTLANGKIAAARVSLGAVAPLPLRAREVEKFLLGRAPDEETADLAGILAVKNAQPLAGNKFKVQLVKALLKKAILAASR
jgi:NADPH-dependent glutamate synthase beta subunit-like oxidoreductase/CO/xanthine dehydrogenase FAD-binding subunit